MPLVILKATEKCNSNCSYCDVVRKDGTGRSMPLDVLETVFRRVNEYLLAFPGENVELNWHGGEPLILGTGYFHEAIRLQKEHFATTSGRIKNTLQTNLTLMSEEFIPIFKQMGINFVGTSFDPEPSVRGPGDDPDSGEYNRQFFRGAEILNRHNIGWGVIYVATRNALENPLEVFYYLTNLVPRSGSILMNPVLIYDESRKAERVTPEEWIGFLSKIFPVWWENRQRYPVVNPFQGYLDKILGDPDNKTPSHVAGCVWNEVNISPGGSAFLREYFRKDPGGYSCGRPAPGARGQACNAPFIRLPRVSLLGSVQRRLSPGCLVRAWGFHAPQPMVRIHPRFSGKIL
jgi:uncharacterized protein